MDTKKIKEHNGDQFLKDIKRCREVLAFVSSTNSFLQVKKMDIKQEAEQKKIKYYVTDKIFTQKRFSMVII